MDLRIFTEPQQGATYDDLLRVAQKAEETGFDAFFRSDHFLSMGGVSGLPGPTDSWVTLGAIARETSRIRLGTLVTAATFRHPSLLAISVAQVDQMSGGRVEFGFGSGWYEAEHQAYGFDLPPLKERFDRYEEQLAIITGLWETPEGETFSFSGKHFQLVDAPGLPKPAQRPRPPVIIGGGGKKRTPALAARYADEFNVAFRDPEGAVAQLELVDAAARAAGRDPKEITRSIAQTVAIGATDAEVARRAATISRDVDQLKRDGLAGTPAEVLDKIGVLREQAGISRIYLQVLDLSDLGHLELIAAEVMSKLD
ncbi:LLM class F420-dependent oxidoreductase [Amycolatopsis pithecellobii]|uniref:TIGR03560 family F420-dependent LLM class oxidoreductase n=1 Tax=Amycolatopsis pithecellobii TaxID=664692 RepID=A0A6N7Z975_9PSEU|nr:LLM class F420-dependent oxidoreductase [Amycolatopsis pithecellobii]MTD58288.1 TIGR03560 family F420-dependent LLM class oxidoreductase [Amycolatopsis pithecellobii]